MNKSNMGLFFSFGIERSRLSFFIFFPPQKSLDSIVSIIQEGNTLKQTFLFNNRPNNYEFKSTRNDWNKAKKL